MTSDEVYRAVLVGCGRMGATIDDEIDDHPSLRLPYSHAAGHTAADRVDLVAAADIDEDQLEAATERYDIPRAYTDYREMIESEDPDIISVATRPGPHAEIVCFAAENGVPAIYCEKALCQSMAQADRMVEACERNGVHFNLSVLRRFMNPYIRLRAAIEDGVIGNPDSIIIQRGTSAALWGHSHTADMLLFLSGDSEVRWVQGTADVDEGDIQDNRVLTDPSVSSGTVQFENGTHGYLTRGGGWETEMIGDNGTLRAYNDGARIQLRHDGGEWGEVTEELCPEHRSATLTCIEELVAALDDDIPTSAPLDAAVAGQEILMGWILSERQEGKRVSLPLEGSDREFRVSPE